MKKIGLLGILLTALVLNTGCLSKDEESHVYQGVCLALTDGGKTLVLANSQPKLNPIKGDKATFDLSKAKVGLAPDVGNIIRVAYFAEKDKNVAIKVMNVSKQDLRKK
ncbi:MAG: hypothetical protein KJ720_13610 [Proteobacteria bacterium]|nr:hypothetical protein [Pseudomonadota bacterium]MBU1449844.1 hypothetical protein [Pseudomonadota bacterium]MBU2467984.1 hypothetical protein [Pseudomonadota bacterium]MBU2516618.1 hypothetical protein [Pseudomonadota bacterium]